MNKKIFYFKIAPMLTATLLLFVAGCAGNGNKTAQAPDPWTKDYAADLADRGLFSQAAQAYEKFLLTPGLDSKTRANATYILADLYRERLSNYDDAMANYLKIKYIDPNTELKSEIDKKMVECLEKSGRSSDAQREMDRAVSAKPKPESKSNSPVVARIGSKNITLSDIDKFILRNGADPAKVTKEEKTGILKDRIANELMASAAERKGYQKDPEVLEQMEDMRKLALARRVLKDELGAGPSVDDEKVKLYYEANKDKFKDDKGVVKPFEQVEREIRNRLEMTAQQSAIQEYIQRLMKTEKVEIMEENITGAASSGKGRGSGE